MESSTTILIRENAMATVFVEAHPKGRQENTAITDYVVEDHADHVLATFGTQREAIEWQNGHSPHVARVRHLNDKKGLKRGDAFRLRWLGLA